MKDLMAFKDEIMSFNDEVKNKYGDIFKMSDEEFKKEVLLNIGNLSKMKRLEKSELLKLGKLVGIDGSNNRIGGAYPHYIEFYRALAKCTNGENTILNRLYSPINSYEEKTSEVLLAEIEMDVAIEVAKKKSTDIIMMDGGLIRYQINNREKYNELKEICIENNIIFFGIIKDIKTNIISRNFCMDESIYDKELLYGRFEKGEMFKVNNEANNKYSDGELVSAFVRMAKGPDITAIDIIKEQEESLENMANLSYTLTPDSSRGVPLWLDIVDKEVKITEVFMRKTIEEYMDRDIFEKFFVSEREKRG